MAEEIPPNATVYVRGLDERVKIEPLCAALQDVFESFGDIIEIVAKKNVKAKGQAFIVYDSAESAQDAIDTLQGFDLFGKPMSLAFAKTRSDATVKREDGDEGLEAHKKHRLAEKERRQAAEAAAQEEAAAHARAKRSANDVLAERPAKTNKTNPAGLLPEEYLPPNKQIIIREFPESYGKEELTALFQRFPGFQDMRVVQGRGIAICDFEDETGATAAKEAMHGQVLGERTMKVTYQRKT